MHNSDDHEVVLVVVRGRVLVAVLAVLVFLCVALLVSCFLRQGRPGGTSAPKAERKRHYRPARADEEGAEDHDN